MKNKIGNIRYLTKYIWEYNPYMFLYIVLCGVIQSLRYATSIIGLKYILDAVEQRKSYQQIISIITIYCLLLLFCHLFVTYSDVYSAKSFSAMSKKMTLEVMEKSLKIDYVCFDDPNYYDKYTRALTQASNAIQSLSGTYISIASSTTTIIVVLSLIITMTETPIYIFLAVVSTLVSYIVLTIKNKWGYEHNKKMTRKHRFLGYISGLFFNSNTAKEIRAFNSSNYFLDLYQKEKKDIIKEDHRFNIKNSIPSYFENFCSIFILFLTFGLISKQILNDLVSIGVFMSTINAVSALTQQLTTLVHNVPNLSIQTQYIDNLKEIMLEKENIEKNSLGAIILPEKATYKIEFQHVYFCYPHNTNKLVLRDLSFIINPSEHVCIVGENGAGKTTIVKLLMRLYDPEQGRILIDDIDIKEYTVESLRRGLSILFQESHLYATTIGSNLFFKDDYYEKEVCDALEKVDLVDKFKEHPQGVNAKVSQVFDEKGVAFSGGEAQRVFLARAYVKKNSILVLDEPSSSLDPISEDKLINVMISTMTEKTTIVISHRLLFCKYMDRVIYLEQGHVVENANHEMLMEMKGKYYTLYNHQIAHYK